MSWTLAIDTATDVRVGLARDAAPVGRAAVTDRMQHAEQLLPLVRMLLAEADLAPKDLDVIIVGLGPGPFTGLRVGIATARVLASVTGARLHGVCSLDVLARQTTTPHPFLVATDARRREVYWAPYDADGRRTGEPAVDRPDDLPALPVVGPATLVHPGLDALPGGPTVIDAGLLAAVDRPDALPDLPVVGPATLVHPLTSLPGGPTTIDAGLLAAVGTELASAGTEPLYLRRPDATLPGATKSVLPTSERR